MPRPIRLHIRTQAMAHNLHIVRTRVGASQIWAVAKANAYGQGIEQAVVGFAQADGLAVLDLEEAVRARQSGWAKPILMIEGAFDSSDLNTMAARELSTVITNDTQAQQFLNASDVPQHVWIKLNTGMNRLGFGGDYSNEVIADIARKISAKTGLPCGFMTHFANADREDGWQAQQEAFLQRLAALKALCGNAVGAVSLANSAASLVVPQSHKDWVRPGIALYGATPFMHDAPGRSAQALGLRPVQSLRAQVIALQHVRSGEEVGYGSRFVASRDSVIAVIACGYADGYPRNAPDGTPVWLEGRIVPIAGRVSMDMITVDVTDHPAVRLGSEAELWGDHVAIDDLANRCGTIGYELMSKVTARVKRVIEHG
jgi:alanine racemase